MYAGGAAELILQYSKSITDIMLMLQAVGSRAGQTFFFFSHPDLSHASSYISQPPVTETFISLTPSSLVLTCVRS